MDNEKTYGNEFRDVTISVQEYRDLVETVMSLREHQSALNVQWCAAMRERDIYRKVCADHGWAADTNE